MIPSLAAAVTGIDANQTMLDVIGNNIANVNTAGFQSGNVQFADLLNQQISGATAPGPTTGGTNPISVGSGTRVASNETSFAQGTLQQTNQPTDVAIQGTGFFVGRQGTTGQYVYTRNGNFSVNANGQLVTSTGAYVQGWPAAGGGVINTNAPTQPITIPQGQVTAPKQTANAFLAGNLPANAAKGTVVTATTTAYDALGNTLPVSLTFTSGGGGNWTLTGTATNSQSGAVTQLFGGGVSVAFNNAGVLTTPASGVLTSTSSPFANGAQMNLNFSQTAGGPISVTQFGGNQTLEIASQDGYAAGSLQTFNIGNDGTITGTYSNGQTQSIGQVATAIFSNMQGLNKLGNLQYQATVASGPAQVGTPGGGGRGSLAGGFLEGSNVDLGQELTNLIIAQNAYQANTKVVTTSNTVLQALENMP